MGHDPLGHDPLCPETGRCRCWLIAKARADERERIARAIIAERDARPLDLMDSPWRAMTVAARIARGGEG